MSELKREELLEWLKLTRFNMDGSGLWDWTMDSEDNRAYQQIVALIKEEVTEGWIEEKAKGISHAFNDIYRVGMEQAKDFIRSLVEEIRGK